MCKKLGFYYNEEKTVQTSTYIEDTIAHRGENKRQEEHISSALVPLCRWFVPLNRGHLHRDTIHNKKRNDTISRNIKHVHKNGLRRKRARLNATYFILQRQVSCIDTITNLLLSNTKSFICIYFQTIRTQKALFLSLIFRCAFAWMKIKRNSFSSVVSSQILRKGMKRIFYTDDTITDLSCVSWDLK